MAILQSHGILLVNSMPVHTPTGNQAKLARLEDTFTFFYYNGTAWITIRLDAPETYSGNIIPDNSDLGTALQALESAIESINEVDGNHTFISRNNTTEDVSPTAVEIPTPVQGDTADIALNSGKIEKWYFSTSWIKAFVIDYTDSTNLSYIPSSSSGSVNSSNGTNATVPAVSASNAGLMLPAHKVKLDFITVTQPVNLNLIESTVNTALQSVIDSNSINLTKSGTSIKADLKISATQGTGVTVSVAGDGLRVSAASESKPTGYLSKAAATTALGVNQKFRYLSANLDGTAEGSVSWT